MNNVHLGIIWNGIKKKNAKTKKKVKQKNIAFKIS